MHQVRRFLPHSSSSSLLPPPLSASIFYMCSPPSPPISSPRSPFFILTSFPRLYHVGGWVGGWVPVLPVLGCLARQPMPARVIRVALAEARRKWIEGQAAAVVGRSEQEYKLLRQETAARRRREVTAGGQPTSPARKNPAKERRYSYHRCNPKSNYGTCCTCSASGWFG